MANFINSTGKTRLIVFYKLIRGDVWWKRKWSNTDMQLLLNNRAEVHCIHSVQNNIQLFYEEYYAFLFFKIGS